MVWMSEKERDRNGMSYKGKSTARQGTGRRYCKRSEKDVQNTKRSMDGHRNRKSRHT